MEHILLTITTGKRRRQKLLAEMLTALFRSHFVAIKPRTYNFSSSIALISVLKGSFASISLIFLDNSRIVRDNLLYLQKQNKKIKCFSFSVTLLLDIYLV